jgi:hypothetical protein
VRIKREHEVWRVGHGRISTNNIFSNPYECWKAMVLAKMVEDVLKSRLGKDSPQEYWVGDLKVIGCKG